MSISGVSNSAVLQVQCEQAPCCVKKVEPWLGREVHYAKDKGAILWKGIAAAIILAVGAALLPFMPIAGGIAMGLGALLGVKTVVDATRENQLEKALTQLVGGKEKLEQLPEFNLSADKLEKMRLHLKKFVTEDVTENVMRITQQNKTIGVAFKYDISNGDKVERAVQFFLFNKSFSSSYSGGHEIGRVKYSIETRSDMKAVEGRALEEMIRTNDFCRDKQLDQV